MKRYTKYSVKYSTLFMYLEGLSRPRAKLLKADRVLVTRLLFMGNLNGYVLVTNLPNTMSMSGRAVPAAMAATVEMA